MIFLSVCRHNVGNGQRVFTSLCIKGPLASVNLICREQHILLSLWRLSTVPTLVIDYTLGINQRAPFNMNYLCDKLHFILKMAHGVIVHSRQTLGSTVMLRMVVRDRSLITGGVGGTTNGKIAGTKLF